MSSRTRTPLVAIVVITLGAFLLVVGTAPFAAALFDAMAKMATMALYVSYALPIFLGVVARRRRVWRTLGPFSLRAMGIPIAIAAVLWSVFVLVVCSLPPNQLPAGMLGVLIAVLLFGYLRFVRGRFAGPKVGLATLED